MLEILYFIVITGSEFSFLQLYYWETSNFSTKKELACTFFYGNQNPKTH